MLQRINWLGLNLNMNQSQQNQYVAWIKDLRNRLNRAPKKKMPQWVQAVKAYLSGTGVIQLTNTVHYGGTNAPASTLTSGWFDITLGRLNFGRSFHVFLDPKGNKIIYFSQSNQLGYKVPP